MDRIKKFLELMRIKHYIKNLLIFVPLFFSKQILFENNLILTCFGFLSFSLMASAIYCINDIIDIENDKKHSTKKSRPIASGIISKREAKVFMVMLIIIAISINLIVSILMKKNIIKAMVFEILYLIINIGYSLGLKKIQILDVVILTSGFIIRLLYGATLTSIVISNWLYLCVMSGSFFLAFGKRRNEIIKQGDNSREVLKKYNKEFLDKFMYVCLVLTIIFYSLWCVDYTTLERIGNNYMVWTIPMLLIICMKYCLNLEGDSSGDPVDVILDDKILFLMISFLGILMITILYIL